MSTDNEALIEACSSGRLKDVEALLASGADPTKGVDERGRHGLRKVFPLTATFRVVARGDALPRVAHRQVERIISALITAGATVLNVDREVLLYAVRLGMPDMLTFLFDKGARVLKFGHELMETSILHHKMECAKRLKLLGVDPNVRDQWGSTTFLDICSGMLRLRMEEPAPYQEDPVHWYRQRMTELFALGVKINNTDHSGVTALMRSIVSNQEVIMRALLQEGASLHPTMRNGVGALHLAAYSGSLLCFKDFVSHVEDREQIEKLKKFRLHPEITEYIDYLMGVPTSHGKPSKLEPPEILYLSSDVAN